MIITYIALAILLALIIYAKPIISKLEAIFMKAALRKINASQNAGMVTRVSF